MEEISLFVSICWPSSRTYIPYFGKRGVTRIDGDLVLGAQACHLHTCKVGPIIRDDGMEKSKVTHDVLSEELNNLPPCDIGGTTSTYLVK